MLDMSSCETGSFGCNNDGRQENGDEEGKYEEHGIRRISSRSSVMTLNSGPDDDAEVQSTVDPMMRCESDGSDVFLRIIVITSGRQDRGVCSSVAVGGVGAAGGGGGGVPYSLMMRYLKLKRGIR